MNRMAVCVCLGALISLHAHGQTPAKDFIHGKRLTYLTAGDVKAKGVEVSFEYPASWRGANGIRPNTLYQVASKDGKGLEICNLVINSLPLPPGFPPGYTPTNKDIEELFEPSGLHEFAPPGVNLVSASRTMIDGQPTAWLQFSRDHEGAGKRIKMMWSQFQIYFDGKFITFGCSVSERADTPDATLQRHYKEFLPMFQQMANTIVIHSKWKRRS